MQSDQNGGWGPTVTPIVLRMANCHSDCYSDVTFCELQPTGKIRLKSVGIKELREADEVL